MRLEHVREIVSSTPNEALSILDSIDRESLNKTNRNLYDLMRIKALDKMYVKHTSDSLILQVNDYFSRNKKSAEYIESVYYCGRVYYDLGDYPTAMKYFQEVIDLTNKTTDRNVLEIRGNATAQLESILSKLHLYKEREPYLLELLKVDQLMKDTINIIDDYITIGQLNINLEKYDEAKKWLLKAKELNGTNENFYPQINIYLGAVKYHKGEYEDALNLIRPNVEKVDTFMLSAVYHYMAAIYGCLGKYDSTFFYAKKLISRKDPINKKNGYKLLLSPELKPYVNKDTAYSYIISYRKILDKELELNTNRAAIIQEKQYNYKIHEHKRRKAEEERRNVLFLLCLAIIVVLVITLLYLYLLLISKKQMVRLHEAMSLISHLEEKLKDSYEFDKNQLKEQSERESIKKYSETSFKKDKTEIEDEKVVRNNLDLVFQDERSLREKLQKRILILQEEVPNTYTIPEEIFDTPVYRKLTEAISKGTSIEGDSSFWVDLEEVVLKTSKDFMRNLAILLGGKIKEQEKHVALLVKCGVTPSEMMKLLNKEKGTISYRRTALGKKAFDMKLETKVVDKLIRLL